MRENGDSIAAGLGPIRDRRPLSCLEYLTGLVDSDLYGTIDARI